MSWTGYGRWIQMNCIISITVSWRSEYAIIAIIAGVGGLVGTDTVVRCKKHDTALKLVIKRHGWDTSAEN